MAEVSTFGALAAAGVLELNDGYRTKRSELGRPGIPILRVAEVLDGSLAPVFRDFVHEDMRRAFDRKTSRPGDVVLTTKGTVGRVARIPASAPEFVYSPQVCFFRVTDRTKLDDRWLYYWFRGREFRSQALTVQDQTDMAPYINLVDVRRTRATLPPILEQRAIAEVLGALDDKIDANSGLATTARKLAISLVAGAQEVASVGELASVRRRQVRVADFVGKQVDHYSLPAFDNGAAPERCAGDVIRSDKFLLDRPSVLVAKLNPHIPRVWHAVPAHNDATPLASTEFVVLQPTSSLTSEELWAACSVPAFMAAVQEQVTGTTGSHQRVRPDDVLGAAVPDPRSLGHELRSAISPLVDRADAALVESARLAALRDALLPPLMDGTLRPETATAVRLHE